MKDLYACNSCSKIIEKNKDNTCHGYCIYDIDCNKVFCDKCKDEESKCYVHESNVFCLRCYKKVANWNNEYYMFYDPDFEFILNNYTLLKCKKEECNIVFLQENRKEYCKEHEEKE